MLDETLASADQDAGYDEPGLASTRRRVRMICTAGQALVLSTLGGCAGDAGPIEIRLAEAGTGEAATLDFLLPDHFFVEHKETMDSVQALFCLHACSYRGLED